MEKSERALLEEINEGIKQLVGLQAVVGKPEEQQIQILRGMGFDWKFIGVATGMNWDAARKRSERMLKSGKANKNGKVKQSAK